LPVLILTLLSFNTFNITHLMGIEASAFTLFTALVFDLLFHFAERLLLHFALKIVLLLTQNRHLPELYLFMQWFSFFMFPATM